MARLVEEVEGYISDIRLFLETRLVKSLAGSNGRFEVDDDWKVIIDCTYAIRSRSHALEQDEQQVIDELLKTLEIDLNAILSVMRTAIAREGGGRQASAAAVAELDNVIGIARNNFVKRARNFSELRRENNKHSVSRVVTINNQGSGSQFILDSKLSHSHVEANVSGAANVDLEHLAEELRRLRSALREQSSNLEQDEAIVEIGRAEAAAVAGDTGALVRHLKSAGHWAFDVATKIGTSVAAAAINKALNG